LKPLLAAFVLTCAAAHAAAAPTAVVMQGTLTGKSDNGASVFLGVPYAAPPVGALRWAPPKPALAYGATPRHATAFGASCPQQLNPQGVMMWSTEYMSPAGPGVAEDCLFLNIWTPKPLDGAPLAADLPVLLFIHGGGYTEGSGAVAVYDGANVAKQGVVVVNLNYRLGALGFMAHTALTAEQGASGNYAIQDQIAALHWLHDNVKAFGGDAAKITIAGQSAGGGSVLALLSSPLAAGLFRAAIVESSPGTGRYASLAAAETAGAASLQQWGVESIPQARALPVSTLMGGGQRGPGGGPIADGKVIPAGKSPVTMSNDVPVIIGYTLDDLFGARAGTVTTADWQQEAAERYGAKAAEFLRYYPGGSDAQATASAKREAADRNMLAPLIDWLGTRGAKQPVYAYLFSHVEPGPQSAQFGAFHTSEVPYLFDTLHLSPGRGFTAVDSHVVQQFSGAAVNFVKTGNPNGAGLPVWKPLTANGRDVMNFADDAQASRIFPVGADAVMAVGKPPRNPGMPGPPPAK